MWIIVMLSFNLAAFGSTKIEDGDGCLSGPKTQFPTYYSGYSWKTIYCDVNGHLFPNIGKSCFEPDINLGKSSNQCQYKTTKILLPNSVSNSKPVRPKECVRCGDGICEPPETKSICKMDCDPKIAPPSKTLEDQENSSTSPTCLFTGTQNESGGTCNCSYCGNGIGSVAKPEGLSCTTACRNACPNGTCRQVSQSENTTSTQTCSFTGTSTNNGLTCQCNYCNSSVGTIPKPGGVGCTAACSAACPNGVCQSTSPNPTTSEGTQTSSGNRCTATGSIYTGLNGYCECRLCSGGLSYIPRPADTLNVRCSRACREACNENTCSGAVDINNSSQATSPVNNGTTAPSACQNQGGGCSTYNDCCASAPFCRGGLCQVNSSSTNSSENSGSSTNSSGGSTGGSSSGNCIPLNGVLLTNGMPCCNGGIACNGFCRAPGNCNSGGGPNGPSGADGSNGGGAGNTACVGKFSAGACSCCNASLTICGFPGAANSQLNLQDCQNECARHVCGP